MLGNVGWVEWSRKDTTSLLCSLRAAIRQTLCFACPLWSVAEYAKQVLRLICVAIWGSLIGLPHGDHLYVGFLKSMMTKNPYHGPRKESLCPKRWLKRIQSHDFEHVHMYVFVLETNKKCFFFNISLNPRLTKLMLYLHIFKGLIFICVRVWVPARGLCAPSAFRWPQCPREDIRSPGTRITGSGELHGVVAENWTMFSAQAANILITGPFVLNPCPILKISQHGTLFTESSKFP